VDALRAATGSTPPSPGALFLELLEPLHPAELHADAPHLPAV